MSVQLSSDDVGIILRNVNPLILMFHPLQIKVEKTFYLLLHVMVV